MTLGKQKQMVLQIKYTESERSAPPNFINSAPFCTPSSAFLVPVISSCALMQHPTPYSGAPVTPASTTILFCA